MTSDQLSNLKVIDITTMPRFLEHIGDCIEQVRQNRIKAGVMFKRGPLERLQEKGEFNPKSLATLYVGVLEGSLNSSEYPTVVRAFIKLFGDEAYRKTVLELVEAENNKTE